MSGLEVAAIFGLPLVSLVAGFLIAIAGTARLLDEKYAEGYAQAVDDEREAGHDARPAPRAVPDLPADQDTDVPAQVAAGEPVPEDWSVSPELARWARLPPREPSASPVVTAEDLEGLHRDTCEQLLAWLETDVPGVALWMAN